MNVYIKFLKFDSDIDEMKVNVMTCWFFKMTIWWNDYLMKWLFDEMTGWCNE
jgi:hypothetical protein